MPESANELITLLNNKDKARKTCLIAFLAGRVDGNPITDLHPAEEWCFGSEQTWNRCYTGRYRADGQGAVIGPLIRQFVQDVAATIDFLKKAPGESVGVLRKADDADWMSLEEALMRLDTGPGIPDEELIRNFASVLQSMLQTGQRLVLFCEVENAPNVKTLGLDHDSVAALLELLPERFALVLAGVNEDTPLATPEQIARIELGPDYLQTSPPEDRSQPLAGDSARGNDTLNVQSEVNALADAIAAKDMEPPLVLGVLGGWGAGKSFVLHLLEQRLLAIRSRNILDHAVRASYPYAGHFYLARFDAWTYAKADLWSSLMQEVLLALNDQIAYEQLSVEHEPKDPEMEQRLREIEDLLGDREAFDEETAAEFLEGLSAADRLRAEDEELPVPEMLTQRYLELKRELFDERFARLLSGEDEFSPEVLEMLTRDDADARRTLERLDNDILWSRLQGLNKRLQDELEKEEKGLREAKLQLADSEARLGEQVDIELRNAHWLTFAQTLSGELGRRFRAAVETAQKQAGVEQDIPFEQAIESAGFLRTAAAGASPRTIAVFVAFVLAGVVVAALGQEAAALWVGLSGVLGSMVESWSRAHSWMKQQIEAFDAFDAKLRARQSERREALIERAQAGANHRAKVEQVAELESKVEAYRRKIGLTAGHPTLLDFIANRLEEGGYAQRLGLLHQVQQDIRQLTEGLLSEALCVRDGAVGRRTEIENVLFPRGLPRVVLFIDDLDRCPPARVVEVLEAAQLLVKTRLFVVVMAMDVRYITKALEKAYEGVLDRRGAPSGLDYIEKIVQIPYRIRPISAEAMPGYLRSQMQLKVEELEPGPSEGGLEQAGPRSFISAPGEATVRIDETIPQGVLSFDRHELELVRDAALAVAIGPRATKRLVNVMKLIKIIWYRGGEDEIPLDIRKTVVFFLSLSARYAEIMRRVLLAMEETVAEPDHARNRKRLPSFLAQIEKDWSGVEGRQSEWTFLRAAAKNPALLPQTMTLEQLGSRNIELIRSFSFVGEVDLPPDPSTHQVAVQLQEPVRISQDGATKKT